MLIFDLQTSIFVGLLVIIGLAAGIGWFIMHNRKPGDLPATTGWQIFQVLPVGVALLVLPDHHIEFMNPAARRLLGAVGGGFSSDELQKALERFTGPVHINAGAEQSGILHQPAFIRWWRYLLNDGEILLVLAEGSDQQYQLRQQAFIGQLMHELRTPLTALVAHSELATSEQTPEAVRLASTQTIKSGAQRMARLVRDMLELYRLETTDELSLRPLNLVLLAEDAISQLILYAEDCGVSLNFEADTPLPLVAGHPDRLKQVFLNLIDNAIKYCRPGDEIRVSLKKKPEGVLCLVQDTGPGIAASDLPNITKRLYRGQAASEIQGSGIGLALVSEILRRHHSSLNIESVTQGPATGTSCQWLLSYAPAL
jgi:signal transduction histidine kinase